jgi:hypothetical protein
MTQTGSQDRDGIKTTLHMVGHGLDTAALPHHQEHFLRASEREEKKDKQHSKNLAILSLLADAVIGGATQNGQQTDESLISLIGDFLQDLFNDDISIEDKFSRASEQFGTPSYEKFSSVDFGGQSNFDQAVEFVLEREGLLSNHANDRGGLTKYGISQKANPDVDVANLTRSDAIAIYKDRYWDSIGADNMNMATALVAFDASVNHGVGTAKNMLNETNGDVGDMLKWRLDFYDGIVDRDSSQGVFLNGWNNRIAHLSDAIEDLYERNDNQRTLVAANAAPAAPAPV